MDDCLGECVSVKRVKSMNILTNNRMECWIINLLQGNITQFWLEYLKELIWQGQSRVVKRNLEHYRYIPQRTNMKTN